MLNMGNLTVVEHALYVDNNVRNSYEVRFTTSGYKWIDVWDE